VNEVGLRIAGYLPDSQPRKRIEPITCHQPSRWL
jgi:hypothetical protein